MLCICITLAAVKSQNDYKYKSNVHKYPHETIVVIKWLALPTQPYPGFDSQGSHFFKYNVA